MISIGVDVAKGKSTNCAMRPYGEIILSPKDYKHSTDDLNMFLEKLKNFKDEVHIIMEATSNYHLPIYHFFRSKDFFVSIINPLEMKRYRCQGIRNPKTDRIGSLIIAQYGIDFWYRTKQQNDRTQERQELRLLGKQYEQYMKSRVARCQLLNQLIDQTMPGVYGLLDDFNRYNGKDKLCDFVFDYWHCDNIIKNSEKVFIKKYLNWLKKKGYRQNENEARQLYFISKTSIPTLPSHLASTKMLVQEAVTVLSMGGVGETLAPRLIAEIG